MKYLILVPILFFFTSCSSKFDIENRIKTAQNIKEESNFNEKIYNATYFDFDIFYKILDSKKSVKIYIEGDGLAWINRYTISSNPTPINPLSFKIASLDSYENVVYLPRVCQYNSVRNCDKKYWTDSRFSNIVVDNTNEILNQIKSDFNINEFELIGFSGGAAISILVASKRDDIKSIITIAGNLNHKLLHEMHNISLMNDSLNPIDYVKNIQNIKQTHYYGANDKVVYKEVIESFVNEFEDKSNIKLIKVNATHNEGWIEYFKENKIEQKN